MNDLWARTPFSELYRSGQKGEHDDHKQQRAAGANPPESPSGRRVVGPSGERLVVGPGEPPPRWIALFQILGTSWRLLMLCAEFEENLAEEAPPPQCRDCVQLSSAYLLPGESSW